MELPTKQPPTAPPSYDEAAYAGGAPPSQLQAGYPAVHPSAMQQGGAGDSPATYSRMEGGGVFPPGGGAVVQPAQAGQFVPMQAPPTVVSHVVVHSAAPSNTCGKCGGQFTAPIQKSSASCTAWCCCIVMFFTMLWPCCCIPFCMDNCKNVRQHCPHCQKRVY